MQDDDDAETLLHRSSDAFVLSRLHLVVICHQDEFLDNDMMQKSGLVAAKSVHATTSFTRAA